MMNLVVFPIEGVSQTLLWQYRAAMPVVWRLFAQSISFRRFYSASTSSFQSFCDFVYGDSSELDHNLAYPSKEGCILGQAENLFGILADGGYATLGVRHGDVCPDYLKGNYFGAWPAACGEFRWHPEYDAFFAECVGFVENAAKAGKPFALYCGDQAGTITDDSPEKQAGKLYHERFSTGFSLLDGTVARIMETLERLSLLANTLVVIYGPYGMDPWKHGVSGGKTRATEPYADMCWTPCIIYFNSTNIQSFENLASSIDLKATILGIMFPERQFGGHASPFSGINLLTTRRDVSFTQNLFALERENVGPAKGLIKSYAATDGDQRLIVSSDGGITGEGGMELYYDVRDPGNTRNLLDFCELNRDGDIVNFGRPEMIHPHFTMSFKPPLVQSVIESYKGMRDILRVLSKTKEERALNHCVEKSQSLLFHESQFRIKRRRS